MTDITSKHTLEAARGFSRALRILQSAWQRCYGDPVPEPDGQSPEGRFRSFASMLIDRALKDPQSGILKGELGGSPDADLPSTIETLLEDAADQSSVSEVDDLTPNELKQAMKQVAFHSQKAEITELALSDFFRVSLDLTFEKSGLKGRINVGANRHFRRLYDYVQEVCRETQRPKGVGLKVTNKGGRGPVAKVPTDPSMLCLTITSKFLPYKETDFD